MVLAILSASLVVVPDLLFSENTSTTPPRFGTCIFLPVKNYTVNEFHMSEKFGKDFATHDFWDLNVESSTWYAFISGYGSEGGTRCFTTDDD